MIQMGMREQDSTKFARVESERLAIERFQRSRPLEQATIDE